MKIQKIFYLVAVFILSLSFITGCGKKEGASNKENNSKTESKDVSITENTPIHIKYEMTGEKEKGTLDMYYKNKNAKLIINANNEGKDLISTIYVKDNILYMIGDVDGKKSGIKMDVSKDESFQKDFGSLMNIKEKLKDYKKEGTDEVLGYKCDVYTKENEKISIYKDLIAMKSVSDKEKMVAIAFEPNADISDGFFDPPKDIEFMSMDDMMKQQP